MQDGQLSCESQDPEYQNVVVRMKKLYEQMKVMSMKSSHGDKSGGNPNLDFSNYD